MSARMLMLLAPVLLGGCATGFDRTSLREGLDAATVRTLGWLDPYDSDTGLYAAVRAGDTLRVRLMLAAHPALLNAPERYTKLPLTPLQIAARENRLAVMKLLIDRGADLEAGADSPLRIAARDGHRKAAELLLAHGAVLDAYSAVALDKRDEVERLLRTAAAFGVAKWLANGRCREYSEEVPLLRVAEARGHAEMVNLLVRYGADPGAKAISHPRYISDNNFKGVTIGAGEPAYDP